MPTHYSQLLQFVTYTLTVIIAEVIQLLVFVKLFAQTVIVHVFVNTVSFVVIHYPLAASIVISLPVSVFVRTIIEKLVIGQLVESLVDT